MHFAIKEKHVKYDVSIMNRTLATSAKIQTFSNNTSEQFNDQYIFFLLYMFIVFFSLEFQENHLVYVIPNNIFFVVHSGFSMVF